MTSKEKKLEKFAFRNDLKCNLASSGKQQLIGRKC